jgi:hypothetical protein
VCVAEPTALTLTRVVLQHVGKVDVSGYIDDGDTGGTFRTQLLADNVTVTVTDGEIPPGQLTVSLTGCRSDLAGTIRCVSADGSATAKFVPQRDAPNQYTMSLHAVGFSPAGALQGPVTVSVRQTNVQRQATLQACVCSGTVLTCR